MKSKVINVAPLGLSTVRLGILESNILRTTIFDATNSTILCTGHGSHTAHTSVPVLQARSTVTPALFAN